MRDRLESAMQRSMDYGLSELKETTVSAAQLGLRCLGSGPAAVTIVQDHLAEHEGHEPSAQADQLSFVQAVPGPDTSLLMALWGSEKGGAWHSFAAVTGFLAPGTTLVVGLIGVISLFGLILPAWTGGLVQGVMIAAVILFARMLFLRAPDMVPGSITAALATLSAALIWFLPDATAQLMALAGCGLIALVLNLKPPETVSFDRHPLYASVNMKWAAGVGLGIIIILPWLLGDSALGWVTSLARASFLAFQNDALLLAALDAELVLPEESLPLGYGLVAASGASSAVLAAVAGFASTDNVVAAALLCLVALGLIHVSTVFSVVFLWPNWQVWRHKNGRKSFLLGLRAAAFGILFAALLNPLLTSAVNGFTSVLLLIAGAVALLRLNCPPWLLAAGLALISAMAAAL